MGFAAPTKGAVTAAPTLASPGPAFSIEAIMKQASVAK